MLIPAIVGGLAGGAAVLAWVLLGAPRTCPDCGTHLPKFRKPETAEQRLRGGWTCPNCKCDIDRRGNKRQIQP